MTFIIVAAGIEVGARIIEQVLNVVERRKNPYVESVNPVPAFKVADVGGVKCVVRSGFHPLMNPELRPFTLTRPKGGLRVFLLGGSAAAGWPFHVGDTNISALLERKLRMLYPGRPIEVINAAAGTYASHRVKLILDEVLHYNPDIIFLYNGNNEFLEGLVYRSRKPPAPWDRSAAIRLAYRFLVPLPRVDVKNFDISAQVPNTLSFAFSKASLYREDPRQFQMLLDHYRFNLEEMVTAAGEAKVPLFLLTCPVNLKDWVPNVSRHGKNLSPEEKNRWTGLFREGYLAAEKKDFAAAIAPLKAAVAADGEYAEAHYRLAEALRHTGQAAAAKTEYQLALQRDAFPFRELPEFQNVLREVAARRRVPLVDIIPPLEAATKDGIIGLDVLVDYVHLTEKSQEIVAQEMMRSLRVQGMLPEISEADVEKARIAIPVRFWAARDVAAADLNYNMAMIMHQYERLDALFGTAIATFSRAADEDPAMAMEYRARMVLFREIHPIVMAYKGLLRAEKLGLREKMYSAEQARQIFSDYSEMIRQVKTPGLTREEFMRRIPEKPSRE